MTETEWLVSDDPAAMLEELRLASLDGWGRSSFPVTSDRKLRLFACACWNSYMALRSGQRGVDYPELREAVALAEEWADKGIDVELAKSHGSIPTYVVLYHDAAEAARQTLYWVDCRGGVSASTQAALARDIFGSPWRPVMRVEPDWKEYVYHDKHILFHTKWLTWNNGTVLRLAQAMYESHNFADMPILADALEEAGCANEDILGHCRQPGPHVRGCFTIDCILGLS